MSIIGPDRVYILTVAIPPLTHPALLLTEMKAIKSYARNRYSRSVEMEIGGDLYAVDLEDGYQPVPAPRNLSQAGARTPRDDSEDDFSGMGVTVTVTPRTSSNSLAIVSSGIKVTHRSGSVWMFNVDGWVCL